MQIKIAFVSFILSLSQEFRVFVLFVFCFYFRFVYPKTKFLRAILALPRPIKRAQQILTHQHEQLFRSRTNTHSIVEQKTTK